MNGKKGLRCWGIIKENKMPIGKPADGLVDFVNKHDKILFVTFGSMINPYPEKTPGQYWIFSSETAFPLSSIPLLEAWFNPLNITLNSYTSLLKYHMNGFYQKCML